MADQNRTKGRDNRRNSGRRRRRKQPSQPRPPRKKRESYDCAFCEKHINEITTALSDSEGRPIHFDCAVKKITAEEELQEGERVCYLGGGSFGIVKDLGSGPLNFFVRKRVQFEKKELRHEWRKKLIEES